MDGMTQGMTHAGAIRLLGAAEGEVLDLLGARFVVKADPARDGLLLADHVVPPGTMVPPHVHAAEDESFFILDGRLTLWTEAGEREAGPGETALLPRGVAHGFRNASAAPVRFLVLVTPGLQALEMFRHLDRAGRAGPLQPAQVGAICAAYGVAILPPPAPG